MKNVTVTTGASGGFGAHVSASVDPDEPSKVRAHHPYGEQHRIWRAPSMPDMTMAAYAATKAAIHNEPANSEYGVLCRSASRSIISKIVV
jgi:hypothetical protein